MSRKLLLPLLGLLSLAAGAWAQAAAQQPYGRAERRDPIFLRFPEMAERFWVNTETMAASLKSLAVPMPKQCAFSHADTYTRGQMSEREVQQMALSNCNAKLNQLGPLGENYAVNCQCQVIISDGAYVVPRETLPDQAYGPASIFYRDDRGNVARLNGTGRYGALIGRDRSVTFAVENPRAEPVASTAPAPAARGPDYTTVLNSPDPDRRKLQESLRTLDKYNGPIDGNLQSEAAMKAISDWQKGHGYNAVGKLTPTEAVTLN